jgi:hypothetical protein
MIKKILVEIDGIDYEVPREINIMIYAEVMRRFSLSESEADKVFDLLTVVLGIPFNILREINPEKLIELSNYIKEKIEQQDVEYIETFTFKDVEYGGLDLNKMSFGEYIDLASYMKNEPSIYTNINKICSILYRPIVDKKGKKYKIIDYDIEQQEEQWETFKELPLKYFVSSFQNVFIYFTKIKKEYEVLFGEERMDTPENDPKREKERDDSNLPWYKMIMALTGEDFTKIEFVTKRPIVECLNHLTYITIKNEEIRQRQIEIQNKNNI